MTPNEFGRRRPSVKSAKPEEPRVDESEHIGLAELARSPLMAQLAGIMGGVLIVVVIIGVYVSGMKGMGRALDAQWAKKTIGPVEDPPDFVALERAGCNVVSLNAKFREVQRELGC